MPTTANKEFQQIRSIPEGVGPNTEVFYHSSTNEVFLDYDEYFERIIQLNSSCWTCNITGRSNLTYDEALQSESEAIEQINNFPSYLEAPILFLINRFTCRGRVDELVVDVMNFMRDRFFIDEEVWYRHSSSQRLPARVIAIDYHDALAKSNGINGTSTESRNEKAATPVKTANNSKSPDKLQKEDAELPPAQCFTYTLQMLGTDGESESTTSSGSDEEVAKERAERRLSGQLHNIPHTQISRGKSNYATRPRIKLFIRYYTELSSGGRMAIKPGAVDDFQLDQLEWEQLFAGPPPKFPQTRKKQKIERILSNSLKNFEFGEPKRQSHSTDNSVLLQPSTSGTRTKQTLEVRKRRIAEQQSQLEPLFRAAEKAGVAELNTRWRQQMLLLSEEDVAELQQSIHESKETERRRQAEKRKREREAQLEWRRPRDDLLCDDLKPFPDYRLLIWPDWVPRVHYWDILSISSFFHSFSEELFSDVRHVFTIPQIATALVSTQVGPQVYLFRVFDVLLSAIETCIAEDEGDASDLTKTDQIGNEAQKDFDHQVHGQRIVRINRRCNLQHKIHGISVSKFSRDHLNVTEVLRQMLLSSGFYTPYRRQTRGGMHCWEDDGYQFVLHETELMELLKKTPVYALSPTQRVKLINVLINQLLSHSRFREQIDQRIDELAEMRRQFRHLKAVDQQHEKEARDAQQAALQQSGARITANEDDKNTQKAKLAAQKELAQLRRNIAQLNEGRRVQNLEEFRNRIVDEQRPLPWREMDGLNEITEFRAAQRNFHFDKVQELLRQIFELQGKMAMFYLGRDRAFRSYYYMNSAFVIYCPSSGELGECGEPTPPIRREDMRRQQQTTEPRRECRAGTDESKALQNSEEVRAEEGGEMEDGKILHSNGGPVDPLMACTGMTNTCPVHNSLESPRLLFYSEKEAVKELLDALNPRGHREMELAESIRAFREIYAGEQSSVGEGHRLHSSSIFGFSVSLPKELQKRAQQSEVAELMLEEVKKRLLEVEEIIHQRNLGTPHCATGREEWRLALSHDGDTSLLCVGNCCPVKRSGNGEQEFVYTREELSASCTADGAALTPVQRLGIALLQLAQGVKDECMHPPFMSETKKNGVTKRVTSNTFVEWQLALKKCTSAAAIALFETTFEFAVDWEYRADTPKQAQNKKVRRRLLQSNGEGAAAATTSDYATNSAAIRQRHISTRQKREAEALLAEASHIMVSGARTRKPVTKYGECEMDLDKLDLDEEDGDREWGEEPAGDQEAKSEDGEEQEARDGVFTDEDEKEEGSEESGSEGMHMGMRGEESDEEAESEGAEDDGESDRSQS